MGKKTTVDVFWGQQKKNIAFHSTTVGDFFFNILHWFSIVLLVNKKNKGENSTEM